MSVDVDQAVRKSILVAAPQERAFEVFTAGFSSWWPLETHHIGSADAVEAVIEPCAGGRWFERGADGSECDWGRVLDWEPPARIRLAWMLGPQWQFNPNEAQATEIEVTFTAEGAAATRVELVHSGFERVEGGEEIRAAVGGEGGWGSLLVGYGEAAAAV
jgi:uncharacterized protein YndB with AHSA1/START domain